MKPNANHQHNHMIDSYENILAKELAA